MPILGGMEEAKPKHAGGRPRFYSSPGDMQTAIDAYFDTVESITICGLALALGFMDRNSLLDYEGYSPEFFRTLKVAKSRVEAYYEEHLVENNVAGSIFALKNFGWQDKIVQERTRDEKEQVEIDEMRTEIEALKNAGDGVPKD